MMLFRVWLVIIFLAISGYTLPVVMDQGLNLFPYFFGDIAKIGWPGQFNLDFLTMLSLSAIWVAWRHQFTGPGLGLSVLAFFGGGLFLSIYLTILCMQVKGGVEEILVGEARLSARSNAV